MTDRQTDRQTDGTAIAYARLQHMLSRATMQQMDSILGRYTAFYFLYLLVSYYQVRLCPLTGNHYNEKLPVKTKIKVVLEITEYAFYHCNHFWFCLNGTLSQLNTMKGREPQSSRKRNMGNAGAGFLPVGSLPIS